MIAIVLQERFMDLFVGVLGCISLLRESIFGHVSGRTIGENMKCTNGNGNEEWR